MNTRNEFTKLAISHHLALGQLAKELIEIDERIESAKTIRPFKSKDIGTKILNLFIKLLA